MNHSTINQETQEELTRDLSHTLLREIAKRFDPTLETVWRAYNEQHLRSFWIELLRSPFRNIVLLFKVAKAKSVITAIVLAAGGYIVSQFEQAKIFILDHKLTFISVAFVLWYVISAIVHLLNMAKIDRKDVFHIVAFRWLRKAEYELFEPFLQQKSLVKLEAIVEWFYKELRNEHLSQELGRAYNERDIYLGMVGELQNENELLMKKLDDKSTMYTYRTELLYSILEGVNRNISRVANDLYDTKALGFIAPYTLYKLEGNTLKFIDEDGTSGNFLKEIDTTNPDFAEYTSVKAINSPKCFAEGDAGPLQGRKIASFFVRLPNANKYVVNFHLDSANLFFQEDETRSIINLRSIYELVEAHCLLMDKLPLAHISHDEQTGQGKVRKEEQL
jgi:hypothetical protein